MKSRFSPTLPNYHPQALPKFPLKLQNTCNHPPPTLYTESGTKNPNNGFPKLQPTKTQISSIEIILHIIYQLYWYIPEIYTSNTQDIPDLYMRYVLDMSLICLWFANFDMLFMCLIYALNMPVRYLRYECEKYLRYTRYVPMTEIFPRNS